MTRTSGFGVTAQVRLRQEEVPKLRLRPGSPCEVEFVFDEVPAGATVGFGGWFLAPENVVVEFDGFSAPHTLTSANPPAWRKFGSQWIDEGGGKIVIVRFTSDLDILFALYGLDCGVVEHDALSTASEAHLRNMWQFAPEGNFYVPGSGEVGVPSIEINSGTAPLALKSCNRCGRFLPINLPPHERDTLSFSNHCISRAPCNHSSFGRIQDAEDEAKIHQMHYGFQLECRFCKKFFVNAPLNPKRTASQMKEDAARRRAFEVLLEQLYEESPQLTYRQRSGRDLAAFVFERFDGSCFKCGVKFSDEKEMNLDHTRPLALLWPLDEHATALCTEHNSDKRDRPPADFYSSDELARLAVTTRLPLSDLQDSSPNVAAIDLLGSRLDWFFDEFIPGGSLLKVRDGKDSASLLIKALQKAIDRYPGGPPFNLQFEAESRGLG